MSDPTLLTHLSPADHARIRRAGECSECEGEGGYEYDSGGQNPDGSWINIWGRCPACRVTGREGVPVLLAMEQQPPEGTLRVVHDGGHLWTAEVDGGYSGFFVPPHAPGAVLVVAEEWHLIAENGRHVPCLRRLFPAGKKRSWLPADQMPLDIHGALRVVAGGCEAVDVDCPLSGLTTDAWLRLSDVENPEVLGRLDASRMANEAQERWKRDHPGDRFAWLLTVHPRETI